MTVESLAPNLDRNTTGQEISQLISELYPICRSITGEGLRVTLQRLQQEIPLELREVPSGTQVFDWVVPKEWNVRDAYVKNARGEKVIDFQHSNLHLVNYSVPIHTRMPLEALKAHLHTLPEHPDWIPYKTSYYKENWGFCLSQRRLQDMEDGEYEVVIDTSLEPGSLTYGELYLKGQIEDEILISCHTCHPSLCNDNLSGVGLATFLAKILLDQPVLRYSYRFLFIPGTIGSITWLALNGEKASRIKHGLVVACVGDGGGLTYKKSRRGDAEIDRAVTQVLKHSGQEYEIQDFSPYGYDERQYSSPGFNLAVGCLSRTPHGRFAEYHTSADNLDFVQAEYLADSLSQYLAVLTILENNKKYINTNPFCEPQLGKRGLYGAMGGRKDSNDLEMSMLWVLNLSDGKNSLLDIAEKSGYEFSLVNEVSRILLDHKLLAEVKD